MTYAQRVQAFGLPAVEAVISAYVGACNASDYKAVRAINHLIELEAWELSPTAKEVVEVQDVVRKYT
jgi:hypothetical protein